MASKRLSMRKIREVLRLCHVASMSGRAIARSIGASPATVGDYLRRAEAAGLDEWSAVEALDEVSLDRRLFPPPPPSSVSRALPDWAEVHQELRRKGVTLELLWQEYRATHPDGYQYSWFCQSYRAWTGKLDLVMLPKSIAPASGCSSITPGRRWRWLTGVPASCARRRCSSPCSGRPATPTPRPPGRRASSTGAPRTCAPSRSSAACPSWWCRTTSGARSAAPAATIPTPTRPTTTSPATTASRCSRPACAGHATRPRPRSACRCSNAGFWRPCASARSSRSAS